LSHRKRAAKSLIARRAFLSLTFIQATLHACIPACDSTFPKFNRITVYFCESSLSRRTFPRMKNARRAIFVRGLFAVSRIYSRFVRAITRFSAQIQRKTHQVSVFSA